MKLRAHLQLLNRFRGVILGCVILFGVLAGVVVTLKPPQYRLSLSFTITQTAPQETSDYQYDGYYAIQSAQLVGDTVASWLRTPAVVYKIYERAKFPAPSESLSRVTSRFRTTNAAPQQVLVTFTDLDEENGRQLAEAIIDEIESRASNLNVRSDGSPLYHVAGDEPVSVAVQKMLPLTVGIGAIIGLGLGILLSYLWWALREEA
jgi:uncharacterized protein involved in exopolysaccharide biosynthesis